MATCDCMRERILLSTSEQRVLSTFRRFLMNPGQMLCFSGPNLKLNESTLKLLTDKDLLIKENFNGGYSLTPTGFEAISDCE